MKTPRKRNVIGGASAAVVGGMLLFLQAWGPTSLVEGGYADHPDDLGGRTMYGITEEVARQTGYSGPMQDLSRETAQLIAKAKYWDPLQLDSIGEEAPDLAMRLFDIGFNAGIGRSGRFLQTCLNVLNLRGRYYSDIGVDGRVGPGTLYAFSRFMERREEKGEVALEECVSGLMVAHYVRISEVRPANESFTYGWMLRAAR